MVPHRSVGTVSREARSKVCVRFGIPRCGERNSVTFKLPRLTVQDHVDQIVQLVETEERELPIAYYEGTELQYSRPWELTGAVPGPARGRRGGVDRDRPSPLDAEPRRAGATVATVTGNAEVHLVGAGAGAMAAVFSEDRQGDRGSASSPGPGWRSRAAT